MAEKCGFITHVKGTKSVKGHSGFVAAVEHAKKQTKPTGVLSVCGGKIKRLALCSNGSCGGSTAGLGGARRRRRKARVVKVARKRRRARRRS